MQFQELRQLVVAAFGQDLERLTPDTLRDFVDLIEVELTPRVPSRPVVLDESAASYDQVMRHFFLRTFDMDQEAALILLWLTAFESWATAYLESTGAGAGPEQADGAC
ncbi:MAG: hypothetical protein ACE5R4_01860 [Armatimonadota bacterium]